MNDEIISAEQLYKILHYSKRKTKYLLDNGIIPCENTGMKTRCYKVKMSDVTVYLDNVKRNGDRTIVPAGIFSSNSQSQPTAQINLTSIGYEQLYGIIKRGLSKLPDALTVDETAVSTGYSTTFIIEKIQSREIYAEKIATHYIIPKERLVSFLAGKEGLAVKYKSTFHKKMLRIFIEGEMRDEKDNTQAG